MSSSLFRSFPFARIPLVRYSAVSKRRNKAEVQLLKDFPNIGKKGQILKVSHSLMRNKLHRYNGACYILPDQGPRIPVYKEPKKVNTQQQQQQIRKEPVFEQPVTPKPKAHELTIEGLLLDLPAGESADSGKIEASRGYSPFALSVNLGDLHFKVPSKEDVLETPITKTVIKNQIKELANADVPEADFAIRSGREVIESITKNGKYQLQIGTIKNEYVRKTIFVNNA